MTDPSVWPKHPLDGAWFKIIWAEHHLKTLRTRLREDLPVSVYSFPFSHDGSEVVAHVPEIRFYPYADIGAIVGDCLHAAMSVLDYIVWELAAQSVTPKRELLPPPFGKDKPSFPLYLTVDEWQKQKRWADVVARYQIPANASAEVEAVQPYNAGYESLGLLFLLVNQDKHRLPLLTIGRVRTGDLSATFEGQTMRVRQSSASRVTFETPDMPPVTSRPPNVQVQGQITPYVTLDDPRMPRESLDVTLEQIIVCVQNVFRKMLPFFPPFAEVHFPRTGGAIAQ